MEDQEEVGEKREGVDKVIRERNLDEGVVEKQRKMATGSRKTSSNVVNRFIYIYILNFKISISNFLLVWF